MQRKYEWSRETKTVLVTVPWLGEPWVRTIAFLPWEEVERARVRYLPPSACARVCGRQESSERTPLASVFLPNWPPHHLLDGKLLLVAVSRLGMNGGKLNLTCFS